MKSSAIAGLVLGLLGAFSSEAGIKSWELWRDTAGHVINAHGGGVMHDGEAYWWYGEHKVYGSAGNAAWVGVHAYRSTDLVNWDDRGIALKVSSDPTSEIGPGCIIERPKVIRNAKTGNYVMYFHLELKGQGYSAAKTGIALANRPEGPFVLVKTLRPNGAMSRDMTLFVDDDGKAYHVFSSEDNRTTHIDELTGDYLGYTGKSVRVFENDETEAPALFKMGGTYWLIGSGCSGWSPNTARLYRAKSVLGPWERLGNPCRGRNPNNGMGPELTWGGQSTCVFPIVGQKDALVAMFDIWRPDNQLDSRYIWTPVKVDEKGVPYLEWNSDWLPQDPGASFADFDRRAEAGENLSVCFFGGSLTWSANASEPNRTGFRGRMADYFTTKYPKARFTFVDAAIGGTGSNLGIFRYERDVQACKPDLVFIDFICNDGGENRNMLSTCCYESLLRRLVGDGIPVVQMFFTFKFWAAHGAPYEADDCHPRLLDYRRLVDAYATGVGDVYRDGLIAALDDGSIAPTREAALDRVWPLDGAHPCDYGYDWFAKIGIVGYERAVREKRVCHVPETPVFGTVEDIRRVNPAEGELPDGWVRKLTFRTSTWYDGLSSRWMADVAAFSGTESKPYAFTADGNFIAFFGEGDEKSVKYDLVLDGKVATTFDASPHVGGSLMTWRTFPVDGWTTGARVTQAVELRPQPSADGTGEVRLGSICTARIVPNPGLVADGVAKDGLLEKLDHGRGK